MKPHSEGPDFNIEADLHADEIAERWFSQYGECDYDGRDHEWHRDDDGDGRGIECGKCGERRAHS